MLTQIQLSRGYWKHSGCPDIRSRVTSLVLTQEGLSPAKMEKLDPASVCWLLSCFLARVPSYIPSLSAVLPMAEVSPVLLVAWRITPLPPSSSVSASRGPCCNHQNSPFCQDLFWVPRTSASVTSLGLPPLGKARCHILVMPLFGFLPMGSPPPPLLPGPLVPPAVVLSLLAS